MVFLILFIHGFLRCMRFARNTHMQNLKKHKNQLQQQLTSRQTNQQTNKKLLYINIHETKRDF